MRTYTFLKCSLICISLVSYAALASSQSLRQAVPHDSTRNAESQTTEEVTFGKWTTDWYGAKKLAFETDRPLLVSAGGYRCSICSNIFKKLLVPAEFTNFAKKNKLVLLTTPETDDTLSTHLARDYKGSGLPPMLYILKVKRLDPTFLGPLTVKGPHPLGPEQALLLNVTTDNPSWDGNEPTACMRTLRQPKTSFGVPEPWNTPRQMIELVSHCFPNTGWTSLAPQPEGPAGYEKAEIFNKRIIKVGDTETIVPALIPNRDNPPQLSTLKDTMGWTPMLAGQMLSPKMPERWYKFKGLPNKRYFLSMILSPQKYDTPLTVSLFETINDKPIFRNHQTLPCSSVDRLEEGLFFETRKDGAATNPKIYYLRFALDASNSPKSSANSNLPTSSESPDAPKALRYTILIHEKTASPAPGTINKPIFKIQPSGSPSTPGQWTMDLKAAKALARQKNKPLLLYFTGHNWCPYCVAFEHMVMQDVEVQTHLSKLPLVMIDNRHRPKTDDGQDLGWGPSLLDEWQEDGYVKTAIGSSPDTISQIKSKLQSNLALQRTLCRPDETTIGFPTAVYCRVTDSDELEPIGRFNSDTLIEEAIALAGLENQKPQNLEKPINPHVYLATLANKRLDQLDELFTIGYQESQQFPTVNSTVLDSTTPGTEPVVLAGTAEESWLQFKSNDGNANEGKSWLFTIVPPTELTHANVPITLTVYDSNRMHILRSSTGTFASPTRLLFVPENAKETTSYWLRISSNDLNQVHQLSVAYKQKKTTAEMMLQNTEIGVYGIQNEEVTAKIPIPLKFFRGEHETTFHYALSSPQEDPIWIPQTIKIPTSAEPLQQDATIMTEIELPAGNGYRAITVLFQCNEGDTCDVPPGSQVKVNVIEHPAFIPFPDRDSRDLTLPKGLPIHIDFPVSVTPSTTGYELAPSTPTNKFINEKKLETLGLKLEDHLKDPSNPRLTLSGCPKLPSNGTNAFELQIILQENNKDVVANGPYRLTLGITIKDIDFPATEIRAFNGILTCSETPVGHVTLEKTAAGLEVAVTTQYHQKPLHAVLKSWTNYDSKDLNNPKLNLLHTFSDGSSLAITINNNGKGYATLSLPNGFIHTASINPAIADAKDYVGLFNVALRPENDTEGTTEGWLSIKIDQQGTALVEATLYKISAASSIGTSLTPLRIKSFLNQKEPDASTNAHKQETTLALFLPFNWNGNMYDGYLSTTLTIDPASAFNPILGTPNRISGCGNSHSLIHYDEKNDVKLAPCGTKFETGRSFMDLINEQTLVFVADPAENLILPNYVSLSEKSTTSPGVFTAESNQGILAGTMPPLSVNLDDGTFTLNLTGLIPTSSGSAEQSSIKIAGIMVPTQKACCNGDDANVAIGYGYFNYADTIYCIRLFPGSTHSYTTLPAPILSNYRLDKNDLLIHCEATDQTIIAKDAQGTLTCFAMKALDVPPSQSTAKAFSGDITLSGNMSWEIAVVPHTQEAKESPSVRTLTLLPEDQTTLVFDTSSPASNTLSKGWNLIAIPASYVLPSNTQFTNAQGNPVSCFSFDEKTQTYTLAKELTAGYAYWLFIDGHEPMELQYRALKASSDSYPPLPQAWGMRACPATSDSAAASTFTAWKFSQGKYILVNDAATLKPHEGIWIHKK